ncbi:MAG TPA: ABC transporter ATP-binding protein [Bryobacteraceae bacterium]|nr:ABC transporter ATP-binding protein [Bryobacteraceae bacterium]
MKDSPPLYLQNVSLSFGSVEVLRDISLSVARREFVAIIGPSGCGKSTLLNVLSGDSQPTSGTIARHGRMRMVYQQDGLFPWQTVAENISLGLRTLADEAKRAQQVAELVELIRLRGFENHYPHQLSGGMRQRVELARALAGDSDMLLMDEPFSSLDYLTRLRLRGDLARLLDERPRTVVLVTHDIEEAAQLADRVLVLTDRPARIRNEISITAPRPRQLADGSVVTAVRQILAELDMEVPSEITR